MNKNVLFSVLMVSVLSACKGKEEDELIPLITGTISPDHPSYNVSGEFEIYKAFAFDDQGTFYAYLSSNPDTHCGDVVNYLMVNGDVFNPENVLSPGKCNMMIKLSDWEGSVDVADDTTVSAQSAIGCAMGEGEFKYMTSGINDTDYYWTGQWWQGVPHGYQWSISGDRESGYTIDVDMYQFNGGFPQEEFDKYDAMGSVQGSIEAYICEGLVSTGL